jgi:hypothetical protein
MLASAGAAADEAAKPKATGAQGQGATVNSSRVDEMNIQGLTLAETREQSWLALDEQQRQAIRGAVQKEDSYQPTPEGFEPRKGAEISRGLNLHSLPRPLAQDIPALNQFMYARIDRVIVLVDPLRKRVVEVIPLPADQVRDSTAKPSATKAALNAIGGLAPLNDLQLRLIYQQIPDKDVHAAPREQAILAGAEIPAAITLTPLPVELVAQIPTVSKLHYARLDDGRLILADPASRKVVGIITRDEGTRTAGGGAKETTTGEGGKAEAKSPDPLKEREQSGKPSAYTGPSTTGPNTDAK